MYARGNSDFLVNSPDGYPSEFGPIYWMGSDVWGGPIGPNGPYGVDVIPAVTRLTAVIVDPLASVPWKVVEQGFGGAVLSTPRWITDPQLLRTDGRFPDGQIWPAVTRSPAVQVWGAWLRSAVLFGMGFLIFLEDEPTQSVTQPKAGTIRVLNPWQVRPVREGQTLVWELDTADGPQRFDFDGYFTDGDLRWRIVCLRDPHAPVDEDGRSLSVFERHPDTFGTAGAIDRYTRGTFTNDGVPSGFLKVNTPGLQPEQANELKASWMTAHGGSRKSVAVLNAVTDYTPLARNALDTALIENKRANLADLCMAFGLDPNGALGISMGNSATYANVQQYFQRLKTDLMPWIESLEQVVSSLLATGKGIRLDFSELTRPDPKTHYEALAVALDAGLLTLDEARNTLGLPALPEPPPAPVPPPVAAPEAVPAPVPAVAPPPPSQRAKPPALQRKALP
jgi:HK97 family phage portal protein